ncbi:hypothetical protein [Citricoccus sp. NR2]|uniref:hypothetical protein n=1 Tax=Citricoccus sp. NR2 TaxID=3004095 RepID=UPI0022DE8030|nr:hypothetical protein [Citricoccus sp. NR2]WBL19328.1 hypothetical protein O1A05_01050 [Citricoccus sp. NR2]
MSHTDTSTRHLFGLSRFGGGPATLILTSLLAGLVTSMLIAVVAVWLDPAGTRSPLLLFTVVTLATLGPASVGWWVALVDRSTLRGATPRPEESVEGLWLQRSLAAAFGICFAVVGLGSGVIAVAHWSVPSDVLLLSVCALMMLSAAGSYLVIRAKES